MAKFARGSYPWLAAPAIVAGLGLLGWQVWGATWTLVVFAVGAGVFLFFLVFFRDPDREPSPGIASPADGRVVRIDEVDDAELGRCDRLCIFMSPTDVHVNRAPLEGAVVSVTHHDGGHIPAWDKDSDRNERVVTVLDTQLGRVKVIQIAGTVARRIVPYITPGQSLAKGERIGLIRLGSRCDLVVPTGKARWLVHVGTKTQAGATQLAEVM